MAAPDWLTYWGAGLSSFLGLREIWKTRRATRPKLVAHISEEPTGLRMEARGPGMAKPTHGIGYIVHVHNRGGAGTVVHRVSLCIARPWLPSFLLELLGEFGLVPTVGNRAEELVLPSYQAQPIDAAPGKEVDVKATLWDEHREALDGGRLMVRIRHTWSRGRAQQMPLRRQG